MCVQVLFEQSGTPYRLERCTKARVIDLARLSRQSHFDVAHTFPIGELRKGHDTKLFRTRQRADAVIALMTLDDALKAGPGQRPHQLSKGCLAGVHVRSSGDNPRAPRVLGIQRSS
jgi:hypothetical protein